MDDMKKYNPNGLWWL